MKRALFAALGIAALLVGLVGTVVAAAPADNPGENPPGFAKVVFITYAKDLAPANSLRPSSAVADVTGSEQDGYIYSGYHWSDAKIPVHYLINPKLPRSKVSSAYVEGIKAAFQTWEDDPDSYMKFTYNGTTNAGISSLRGRMDRKNVVGWADLNSVPWLGPDVIAVSVYWYNTDTLELAEVDVAMNSKGFTWWQTPSQTGDPDTWTWPNSQNSSAYDVDVQNIMTHEAGHCLVLDDLYDPSNSDETMYGYADEFELNKRSLENADIAGIGVIYPGSTKP
jgi:hypothetical protein